MHIHILGICGTFMAGVARLAAAAGHKVTGSDANVYPPMSDQLKDAGIELTQGYNAEDISIKPDLWVIGNAIGRGNPLLEEILDRGEPYTSGPQWLSENVLRGRHVQLPFQGGGPIVPLVIMSNRNLSAQQCRAFQQYLLNRVVRYTQYRKTLDMADIIDI